MKAENIPVNNTGMITNFISSNTPNITERESGQSAVTVSAESAPEAAYCLFGSRKSDTNKGSYGRLLLVCGSERFRGAAALAARAALFSGVGIAELASVGPVLSAVAAKLDECIFLPLKTGEEGGIDGCESGRIAESSYHSSATLAGCGMGNTSDTQSIISALIMTERPLVLDADGLNALCGNHESMKLIEKRSAPLIITPHIGEMSRLSGLSIAEIKKAPQKTALGFAEKYGCITVLKDNVTYIASPDGRLTVSTLGNPGLARGGSGDVLAGTIAGLTAVMASKKGGAFCGSDAYDAAVAGVWLHGSAANLCRDENGEITMLPSMLTGYYGKAIQTLKR